MTTILQVTLLLTIYELCDSASSYYPYTRHQNNYNDDYNIKQYTRNITLKQGTLQGIVVEPKINRALPSVEQYRGIPYAAAPVGDLRFMPSGSAPSWFGTKYADTYGPVCPQQFPDEKIMAPERRAYFLRLKEYLQNQSEDCLYLNIYSPYQGDGTNPRKYPVMIFLHGESFEWNSGNPYDGSVLAGYGKVIVVTLNYRLGILGFLKAGVDDFAKSNFGLIDQIAALLWVKDNIAAFGGDPSAVTLFGHGTGAVCASLLMLSPLHGTQMLFQRAILMAGTALADWALAGNPRAVTYQVSQALNCQFQDDFAACLRRKPLAEIMNVGAKTSAYKTRFGPVVDSVVVPNDPKKSMAQYSDIFKRFELMYGVSELESVHLLGPVELTHGMLEKERDEELRSYVRSRCEMEPELCLARTLAEYTQPEFALNDENIPQPKSTGQEPDRATLARDALLDILSDARTVAPIVQTARYHAALNLQSYFYVFAHKTSSKEYIRNKSYNGDELPYVFGVPLDGPKFHFVDHYNEKEQLFSEIIMMYFSNFAYTGNPNVPRKNEFYSSRPADWFQFDVEWPEFDIKQERYLQLKIPPQYAEHYRSREMIYWNDVFPELAKYKENISTPRPFPRKFPNIPRGRPPPLFVFHNFSDPDKIAPNYPYRKYENFLKPLETQPPKDVYGVIQTIGRDRPYNIEEKTYGVLQSSPEETANVQEVQQGSSFNLLIVGGLFIIVMLNILILAGLYYKCYKVKCKNSLPKQNETTEIKDEEPKNNEDALENGCNIVKIIRSSSSKSEDIYEGTKSESRKSKVKLTRQLSNSTIDAHTKVRDWITQEIVNKYSPRFLRRNRHASVKIPKSCANNISLDLTEKDSTLGRSPTRPVSTEILKVEPSTSYATVNSKPKKVSVGVDATPTGRGSSVLMQQPIELTKSLDYDHYHPENEVPLRRSMTLEDFSPRTVDCKKELRKSTTSINLKFTPEIHPTIVKIEHSHSRSEPVEDMYGFTKVNRLKTFDPNADINVTSRDNIETIPLTPEESLMTIKRRNFPKVLPDHPGREALAHKRRSMPAHCLFLPIPENPSFSQPNSPNFKFPPLPPPRTTSSLDRNNTLPQAICQSEPMLAEEPPVSQEPEVVCNNLYVGPLTMKKKPELKKDNSQEIYACLRAKDDEIKNLEQKPKTIIAANQPGSLNKRIAEPKYVIKPTTSKKDASQNSKNIPRVVASDNQPQIHVKKENESGEAMSKLPVKVVKAKSKSHIPTPVKSGSTNKESSSSESTPSEESDTGTVVKRL
ncbi:unnamed protein product [Brassicogethes aeneus]|uniref:Carboxylesterase type B domain-containing protein n=1 Tax=Brassicogethes aeneus TaxID=1431903 RepID=A0A9P0FIG8_BRAAE|nr:unnamed protein product [Brassicogethes aeneus]